MAGARIAGGDLSGNLAAASITDGAVDSQDISDVERQILIPVGEINPPQSTGTAPAVSVLSGGAVTFLFDDNTQQSVSLTTRVPADRVPGTAINVDFIWSPATAATADLQVVWAVNSFSAGPGDDMTPSVSSDSAPPASAVAVDRQTVSTATISGAGLTNGDLLVMTPARSPGSVDDDHPGDAQLHLLAIRYTADR